MILSQCFESSAQKTNEAILQTVAHFGSSSSGEKIYVHLDRPSYMVGELIWGKIYCVNEFLRWSAISKVVYIELVDSESKAVLQSKVELIEGKGDFSLSVPTNLISGRYGIRVYTHWMKNFGNSHFFETELVIINPFENIEVQKDSLIETRVEVDFFPEGGYLVAGHLNRMGYRIIENTPSNKSYTGVITDQNGKEIVHFESSRSGIGSFSFKPENNHHYQAVIRSADGEKFPVKLPEIVFKGASLKIDATENGVTIYPLVCGLLDQKFFVLNYKGTQSVLKGVEVTTAPIHFNKSELFDGVNVFALLDSKGNPLSERLWFEMPQKNVTTEILMLKNSYKTREPVEFQLSSPENDAVIDGSLSIFLSDLDHSNAPIISSKSSLLLTSELTGEIENPNYYFEETDDKKLQELDDLMLVNGWRRYQLKEVLSSDTIKPIYLPELYHHLLSGRITSRGNQQSVSKKNVYLGFPSQKVMPYLVVTDSSGRFLTEAPRFSNNRELILQTNWEIDSSYKVVLDNPFSDTKFRKSLHRTFYNTSTKEELEEKSIQMQVTNSLYSIQKLKPDLDSTTFYSRPSYRYYLDNYTRFRTLEEVVTEYIPTVFLRRNKSKPFFRVVGENINTVFTENPLVLVDGVPVFNIDNVLKIDPLQLKRIDVVAEQYVYGDMLFSGIISFSSYKGNLANFELDEKAIVLNYEGFQAQREFYLPEHKSQNKRSQRKPDYRNLLYWNSNIRIKENEKLKLSFYANDLVGRYRVVFQGVTDTGLPVVKESFFEISN